MKLLLFLLLTNALLAKTSSTFDNVKYIDNYDGDTITFDIPEVHPLLGEKIKIRLNGVDTPEIKTQYPCEKKLALQAKELVKKLLSNARKIELRNASRGKYFRLVADIRFDGSDLGKILLDQKLAIPYDGRKKPDNPWCYRKQRKR